MLKSNRVAVRHVPSTKVNIDGISPESTLIDFEVVLQELQLELADDEELRVILPPVRRSDTSLEVRLQNGATINYQQEVSSKSRNFKILINLNDSAASKSKEPARDKERSDDRSNKLLVASVKSLGKPAPPIYIEIRPSDPERLAKIQQLFKSKGYRILDESPGITQREESRLGRRI